MDPAAELTGGGGEVVVGEVAHGYLELGVAGLGGREATEVGFFLHAKKVKELKS